MEKRLLSLLVIFALAVHTVTAAYVCSDGGLIREDIGEIDVGKKRIINGLSLGLVHADEAVATNKRLVEMITDVQIASLTNQSPSMAVNFTNGKSYTLRMTNSTAVNANIKVGAVSDLIEEGDAVTLGGIEIFLFQAHGYPEEQSVEILVGVENVFLDSSVNEEEIVKVNNTEFLVDLFSSSDEDTVIRVRKCDNSSAKFVVLQSNSSATQNNTTNNQTQTNETEDSQNQTENGDEETREETTNETDQEEDQLPPETREGKIIKYVTLVGGAILLLIVVVLGINYVRNRMRREAVEKKPEEIKQDDQGTSS